VIPSPRYPRLLRPLARGRMLASYPGAAGRRPLAALRYLLRGRELTNFTYPLENVDALAGVVAAALGRPRDEVRSLVREAEEDHELRRELSARLCAHPEREDEPHFGRRLGWYAAVRALRPDVIVETGVHDGLGSALLARALERNGRGHMLGFDIDPASGWLVPEGLRDRVRLVFGDVRETLEPALAREAVGVFVHDSEHTYEHECWELDVVLRHAAPTVALISDNAHASSALADVCREHGIAYHLFRERPREHFYPGAAVGIGVLNRA
jgi:predicted O-methyltransferase YrrM